MADKIVFRSTHPRVLAAWEEFQGSRAAAVHELKVIATEIDPDGQGRDVRAFGGFRPHASGLVATRVDRMAPPPGWTYNEKRDCITPMRRSAAGKAAYKRLMDWTAPSPQFPGMPRDSWVDRPNRTGAMTVLHPGIGVLEGVAYACWPGDAVLTVDRMMSDGRGVDPDMWEPCPLSEFYAVVERTGTEI